MRKIALLSLLATAIFIDLMTLGTQSSRAEGQVLEHKIHGHKAFAVTQESMKIAQAGNDPTPQLVTNQRAMTVIGQGQVTAPADIARLEFRFASREPFNAPELGTQGLPVQAAREITEAALKPVVDALVAIGVPVRNIQIQTSSVESPKVLVRLDKPTRDRVQQAVTTVDRAVKTNSRLFVQSIGAVYAVNNCQPLERAARRVALRDAQNQVRSLATDLNVKVGDLLLVTVLPLSGSPAAFSTCGSKTSVSLLPFPAPVNEAAPPYNPSDPAEVQVRSQVSVTYGIK